MPLRMLDPKLSIMSKALPRQILASSNKRQRLLLLGDTSAFGNLVVPLAVTRYNFRPLSTAQRRTVISKLMGVETEAVDFALGDAASNPALFALALQVKDQGNQPEAILDAWLGKLADSADVEQNAFHQIGQEIRRVPALEVKLERPSDKSPLLARSRKVKYLLAARYLSSLPADVAVAFYKHHPILTADIMQSLITRLRNTSPDNLGDLTQALLQAGDTISHRAALIIAKAGNISAQLEQPICHAPLAITEEGQLPITERQDAASVLSRFGDSRDLAALVDLPVSTVTLGSNTLPNSQPKHD